MSATGIKLNLPTANQAATQIMQERMRLVERQKGIVEQAVRRAIASGNTTVNISEVLDESIISSLRDLGYKVDHIQQHNEVSYCITIRFTDQS